METRSPGDRLSELEVEDELEGEDAEVELLAPGKRSHFESLLRQSSPTKLPKGLRRELEAELGVSLEAVRVHDDQAARAAAAAVSARAFTMGQSIYFGGSFDPSSALTRHEIAHAVQQQGAIVDGAGLTVSRPGDVHERQAERFAEARALPLSSQAGQQARARGTTPVPAGARPVAVGALSRAVVQRDALPDAPSGRRQRILHAISENLRLQKELKWTAPAGWGDPAKVPFVMNVERFQRASGRTVTGILDQGTWEALRARQTAEAREVFVGCRGESPVVAPRPHSFAFSQFVARCGASTLYRWHVVDEGGRGGLDQMLDDGAEQVMLDGKRAIRFIDDGDRFRLRLAGPGKFRVVAEALDGKSGEAIGRGQFLHQVVARHDVDYIAETLKGIVRGFAGATASTLEGVAIMAKELDWFDEYQDKDATELATYQAAQALKAWSQQAFPADKDMQESFYVQVAEGIGSSLSFMLGGVGTKLMIKGGTKAAAASAAQGGAKAAGKATATTVAQQVAPAVPIATLGAGAGAAESYERARKAGFDDQTARDCAKWGFLVGTTEAVPLTWLLAKFDRLAKGRLRKLIVEVVEQGAEEAAQEGVSQLAQNEIAHQLYDANRDWANAFQSGQVGGASGGVTAFLMAMVAKAAGLRARGSSHSRVDATQPAAAAAAAAPTPKAATAAPTPEAAAPRPTGQRKRSGPAVATLPRPDAPTKLDDLAATRTGVIKDAAERAIERVQRVERAIQQRVLVMLGTDISLTSLDHINNGQHVVLDPSYFNLYVHGSPDLITFDRNVQNQETGKVESKLTQLGSRDVAKLIRSYGWRKGQAVRLLSCSTGAGENSLAQHLANQLGVEVTAPTKDFTVHNQGEHGEFHVFESNEPVEWITFSPKKVDDPAGRAAPAGTHGDPLPGSAAETLRGMQLAEPAAGMSDEQLVASATAMLSSHALHADQGELTPANVKVAVAGLRDHVGRRHRMLQSLDPAALVSTETADDARADAQALEVLEEYARRSGIEVQAASPAPMLSAKQRERLHFAETMFGESTLDELKVSLETLGQRRADLLGLAPGAPVFEQLAGRNAADPSSVDHAISQLLSTVRSDDLAAVDAAMLHETKKRLDQASPAGGAAKDAAAKPAPMNRITNRLHDRMGVAVAPLAADSTDQGGYSQEDATLHVEPATLEGGRPDTSVLHETHHAYTDRRKLFDGQDSLLTGTMEATEDGLPSDKPMAMRILELSPSGSAYQSGQGLNELSAFGREPRQILGALHQAFRAGNDAEVQRLAEQLFLTAQTGFTIAVQTKLVMQRAIARVDEGDVVAGAMVPHRTEETRGGVREALEIDVLHAGQIVPRGREGEADAFLNIPLPGSTDASLRTDYRNRLERILGVAGQALPLFDSVIGKLEGVRTGAEVVADPKTGEPVVKLSHRIDESVIEELRASTGKLVELVRAASTVPLAAPLETRRSVVDGSAAGRAAVVDPVVSPRNVPALHANAGTGPAVSPTLTPAEPQLSPKSPPVAGRAVLDPEELAARTKPGEQTTINGIKVKRLDFTPAPGQAWRQWQILPDESSPQGKWAKSWWDRFGVTVITHSKWDGGTWDVETRTLGVSSNALGTNLDFLTESHEVKHAMLDLRRSITGFDEAWLGEVRANDKAGLSYQPYGGLPAGFQQGFRFDELLNALVNARSSALGLAHPENGKTDFQRELGVHVGRAAQLAAAIAHYTSDAEGQRGELRYRDITTFRTGKPERFRVLSSYVSTSDAQVRVPNGYDAKDDREINHEVAQQRLAELSRRTAAAVKPLEELMAEVDALATDFGMDPTEYAVRAAKIAEVIRALEEGLTEGGPVAPSSGAEAARLDATTKDAAGDQNDVAKPPGGESNAGPPERGRPQDWAPPTAAAAPGIGAAATESTGKATTSEAPEPMFRRQRDQLWAGLAPGEETAIEGIRLEKVIDERPGNDPTLTPALWVVVPDESTPQGRWAKMMKEQFGVAVTAHNREGGGWWWPERRILNMPIAWSPNYLTQSHEVRHSMGDLQRSITGFDEAWLGSTQTTSEAGFFPGHPELAIYNRSFRFDEVRSWVLNARSLAIGIANPGNGVSTVYAGEALEARLSAAIELARVTAASAREAMAVAGDAQVGGRLVETFDVELTADAEKARELAPRPRPADPTKDYRKPFETVVAEVVMRAGNGTTTVMPGGPRGKADWDHGQKTNYDANREIARQRLEALATRCEDAALRLQSLLIEAGKLPHYQTKPFDQHALDRAGAIADELTAVERMLAARGPVAPPIGDPSYLAATATESPTDARPPERGRPEDSARATAAGAPITRAAEQSPTVPSKRARREVMTASDAVAEIETYARDRLPPEDAQVAISFLRASFEHTHSLNPGAATDATVQEVMHATDATPYLPRLEAMLPDLERRVGGESVPLAPGVAYGARPIKEKRARGKNSSENIASELLAEIREVVRRGSVDLAEYRRLTGLYQDAFGLHDHSFISMATVMAPFMPLLSTNRVLASRDINRAYAMGVSYEGILAAEGQAFADGYSTDMPGFADHDRGHYKRNIDTGRALSRDFLPAAIKRTRFYARFEAWVDTKPDPLTRKILDFAWQDLTHGAGMTTTPTALQRNLPRMINARNLLYKLHHPKDFGAELAVGETAGRQVTLADVQSALDDFKGFVDDAVAHERRDFEPEIVGEPGVTTSRLATW